MSALIGLELVNLERSRARRPPPVVTDADRQWWLERFSLEEIRAMASAMWPEVT
jgi:hypothetical protein